LASPLFPGRVFAFVTFLVLSLVILGSIYRVRKGGSVSLRRIAGYEALKEAVGRAVEMGNPIHFTAGYYAVTLEIMAGLRCLSHLAGLAAQYDAGLVATTAKGDTYAVTEGVVQQAFFKAGRPEYYKPEMVRYLSDNEYAFASGVMGILTREKACVNVMMGQFASESLLLAETGYAAGALQIAGTASIAQLPFFVATCDYVVIGEELFAAEAYFEGNLASLGAIRGQDLVKAISLGMIVIGSLLQTFGSNILLDLMKK
jgi:hypothetical protein